MTDETEPSGPPEHEPLPPRRAILTLVGIFAGLALVLGLVGWFVMTRTSDEDVATSGTGDPGPTIPLPLVPAPTPAPVPDNATPDSDSDGDGDTEGLVSASSDEFVITFSNIGRWALGETEAGFDTIAGPPVSAGECGTTDVSDGIYLRGTMTGAGEAAEIDEIAVGDERYRTSSGVGVGTTLDGLRRVYGERLVVDEVDGWESPTDGLLASYSRVAGVRDADFALTFVLGPGEFGSPDDESDTVVSVEVSAADAWGDDEGCA